LEVSFYSQNEIDPKDWNKDIKNPTQLWEYSKTASKHSTPVFLIIRDENRILKWLFFVSGLKYFSYVSIVSEPTNEDIDLLNVALEKIVEKYKPFKISFYSMVLSKFKNEDFFKRNSFSIHKYATALIDLHQDEDVLFTKIHPKHRNMIRHAEKAGVVFYENTTSEGISNYFELAKQTYAKSNKSVPNLHYLNNWYKALAQSGNLKVFFTILDNELQASAIMIFTKHVVIYLHGASRNEMYPGSSNYLHWNMIKFFKYNGVEEYDFGGVSLDFTDEKAQSISFFKRRFGGNLVNYYGGEKIYGNSRNYLYNQIFHLIKGK
jgi:lipid II:glycine glycyltransferase (peptidoglycan interpeptide bridge formation enzyme)